MTELGVSIIKQHLEQIPTGPGVYRMLDSAGKALYVGKARNLRNRVTSYTNIGNLSGRILRMVNQTASMEVTLAKNEAEALLLEASLVKQHQPRYNILLKDDKSFPYIYVSLEHDYPRISKYRGPLTGKGMYFGPFASAGAVNQTITLLQRAFLLRPCADTVFKNRARPCLQYQIKRCSAPCVQKVTTGDYRALIDQAIRFLSGKSREIQDQLIAEMQTASEALDFEKAARLRDRVRALTQVQSEQHMHVSGLDEADVLGLYREGERCCVQAFFFRSGSNFGTHSYFPTHAAEDSDSDVLSAFIGQFYQRHHPPKQIIISHPLEDTEVLEEALCLRAGHKVELLHPQRGDKRQLIEKVVGNAKQALAQHITSQATQTALLEKVAEQFGLEAAPERIEVYDNSHISGTHAVGAMIVGGPEGFSKKHYRKFNIKSTALAPGDDYAMLREVLVRRFTRLQEEEAEGTSSQRPDLVLIDGGLGQLNVAAEVFQELGISDVCFAAISKGPDRNAGREWFHMIGKESFQLPTNDPVLHYLQRLRDEAHRFAIGAHRIRRSSVIQRSELDQIQGIGTLRKKALLLHFGSSKAVSNASIQEIASVPGISQKVAEIIYRHFHQ